MFNVDLSNWVRGQKSLRRNRVGVRPQVEFLEPKIVLDASLATVQVIQLSDGTDTLYDDGRVTFIPDANHPGNPISAYSGTQQVVEMVAAGGGVVTRFGEGGTYFSPDGREIGGGGNTVHAYDGAQTVIKMV